jgi:hypothetical protein
MRNLILILFTFFILRVSFAQEDTKPEYYSILKTADNAFEAGDYSDAIPLYIKVLNLNSEEFLTQLRLGISLFNEGKDKLSAIPYLFKAKNAQLGEANFYLGKAYHLAEKFDSSRMFYESFIPFLKYSNIKQKEYERAVDQTFTAEKMLQFPTSIKVKNLGKSINSTISEYGLIIKADNSMAWFTSRKDDTRGSKSDSYGRFYEDIYLAKITESGFEEIENVGTPLNSKEHDATVAISADASFMIIYRTDPFSGEGNLYFSENLGEEWSVPVKLGLNVNSSSSESSACLSADGQILIFSSNREGGFGGLDIYKSIKSKNGVWGKAVNLGQSINTSEDDDAPFLNFDAKTLYYSSKGHAQNMGGYDIFKSELLSNGTWSTPQNMGSPVNSTADELFFFRTSTQKTAFFSSNRKGGLGEMDIYQVNFETDTCGIRIVKGKIVGNKENTNPKATINVIEISSGKSIANYQSNANTGEYLVILPDFGAYQLVFENGNKTIQELIEKNIEKRFSIIEKDIKFE